MCRLYSKANIDDYAVSLSASLFSVHGTRNALLPSCITCSNWQMSNELTGLKYDNFILLKTQNCSQQMAQRHCTGPADWCPLRPWVI